MHIYFSGIGGVGLGPLAEIARDAGFTVSGSDLSPSLMTDQLTQKGVAVSFTQDSDSISHTHASHPIDWFVHTAALPEDHPELRFARENNIKISKRDELLAYIIKEKNLKLIAVAGTHGKTTTTAMLVWAMQQCHIPVSYSIGTQVSFGPSGKYDSASEFFIYECDEFDRNFLHFKPTVSLITNIDYDHPDTYPTPQSYTDAFEAFIRQSQLCIIWQEYIRENTSLETNTTLRTIDRQSDEVQQAVEKLPLIGKHNRENAHLAASLLQEYFHIDHESIVSALATFPGTSRRFEKLADNLYSDYAHHPIEIAATIQLAQEVSPTVYVVYQPHQNARQYDVKKDYDHCFDSASGVYWLPTYLSRENTLQPVLSADELGSIVEGVDTKTAQMDADLWQSIEDRRKSGIVVLMGAGDIDTWARQQLALS